MTEAEATDYRTKELHSLLEELGLPEEQINGWTARVRGDVKRRGVYTHLGDGKTYDSLAGVERRVREDLVSHAAFMGVVLVALAI